MSKINDLIDISIRIGNTHDWDNIKPGMTYYFRVYRNTTIKELKSLFCECFDSPIREELERYEIYTKNIIRLNDMNFISDAFEDSEECVLDVIDRGDNLFYALSI